MNVGELALWSRIGTLDVTMSRFSPHCAHWTFKYHLIWNEMLQLQCFGCTWGKKVWLGMIYNCLLSHLYIQNMSICYQLRPLVQMFNFYCHFSCRPYIRIMKKSVSFTSFHKLFPKPFEAFFLIKHRSQMCFVSSESSVEFHNYFFERGFLRFFFFFFWKHLLSNAVSVLRCASSTVKTRHYSRSHLQHQARSIIFLENHYGCVLPWGGSFCGENRSRGMTVSNTLITSPAKPDNGNWILVLPVSVCWRHNGTKIALMNSWHSKIHNFGLNIIA